MIVTLIAIGCLFPALLAAAYYFGLTFLIPRRRQIWSTSQDSNCAFGILIPAHDEVAVLGQTLEALRKVDYPSQDLRILVVADNCTDGTAPLARQYGVEVVERFDQQQRGKGFAIQHGLPTLVASRPDAIVILDSDCLVSPNFFSEVAKAIQAGEQALQVRVKSFAFHSGSAAYIAAVGAEIDHALAVGRARLGGTVPLRGTGMIFHRDLLERIPWTTAGLVEDAQYDGRLRKAGVRVGHVAEASIDSFSPHQDKDFLVQRRRWRHALFEQTVPVWERLLHSKPLLLLQLVVTIAVVTLATILTAGPLVWALWLGVTLALLATLAVYVRAIHQVGWQRENIGYFLRAPGLLLRLAAITLAGYWQQTHVWQRTPRTSA